MVDILNAPLAETTTTETPTSSTTTLSPVSPEWVTKIEDAELRGHLTNKGWDRLSPEQAVAEAVKAQRNAEQLMRAPADQLVRIPRADDPDGQRAFWAKFGAPEKPEDYKLDDVVAFEDEQLSRDFADTLRRLGSENHLPADALKKVAEGLVKFTQDRDANLRIERETIKEGEMRELAEAWGPKNGIRFTANMNLANQTAEQYGLTQDQVNGIAEVIGPAAAAKFFHKIGTSMGEDRNGLIANMASNAPISTADQANARLRELKSDEAFGKRLTKGDENAMREWKALLRIAAGA